MRDDPLLLRMRHDARCILEAAISAADPYVCVRRALASGPAADVIRLHGTAAPAGRGSGLYVVGCGKAGVPMALAVEDALGDAVRDGVVIVKAGHLGPRRPLRVRVKEAAHPEPDLAGVAGAQAAANLLDQAGADDLVLALVSGGGSALWPLPAPGLSLADQQAMTRLLLACGATIHEINVVRKHLSAIQGGRAAQRASPARVLVLLLSDVIGDPPDVIASGPFAPDPSSFADAWQVIRRYGLESAAPAGVLRHLRRGLEGRVPETPKPGDPVFDRVTHVLCGTQAMALDAAVAKAAQLGYQPFRWEEPIIGEARLAAERFCRPLLSSRASVGGRRAWIAGGETTVTLGPRPGRGGRNQEFALAAALAIEGSTSDVVASCATDGTDGPTDAAGGIVDGRTAQRIRAAGRDPVADLSGHDAYPALLASGDLLVTGPTGTNVMDIQLALSQSP